ncbi:MAG: hypothetical protein NVSMB12_19030 [Acidimicrobiales bacterium]
MKVLCSTCDVPIGNLGDRCTNYWCGRDDRGFDVVWAVGEHDGELRRAIAALKYRGDRRRADPLARRLAAFLLANAGAFEDVDLIVGTPGATSERRPVDHVREVLAVLDRLIGGQWPVDVATPIVEKRGSTRSMVDIPSAALRRVWAAGELRAALHVVEPDRVVGRRILVVDDVFTDGSTLREVALALRRAGAAAVSGLVLARRHRTGHLRIPGHPW